MSEFLKPLRLGCKTLQNMFKSDIMCIQIRNTFGVPHCPKWTLEHIGGIRSQTQILIASWDQISCSCCVQPLCTDSGLQRDKVDKALVDFSTFFHGHTDVTS
jgi:hypothetical protein